MLKSQQIESGSVRMTALWPSLLETSLQLGNLVGCSPASKSDRLSDDWVLGRLRTGLAPQHVYRIFGQRGELDALWRKCRLQSIDLARRVVPWVETDDVAFADVRYEPFGELRAREQRNFENAGIGFGGGLHGIAAVDHQDCGFLRDDRDAGGA